MRGADAAEGRAVAAYEVRERPLLRCLVIPFGDPLGIVWLAAFFVLFAGGWPTIVAGAVIVLLHALSYRSRARADASGVHITNRIFRQHIPWEDVAAVMRRRAGMGAPFARVAVYRRNSPLVSTSIYATVAMSRSKQSEIADAIADVGRQAGYEIRSGTQEEFEATRE